MFICTIGLVSFSHAQGFDSISSPPDITVKKGKDSSITWRVSITTVSNPTYGIYNNSIVYFEGYTWELGSDDTASFTIYLDTSTVGVYNYTIKVQDGLGNSIQDEVIVTIESRSAAGVWWSEGGWIYIVSGVVLVGFMTAMVFMRQKGFKKAGSLISD